MPLRLEAFNDRERINLTADERVTLLMRRAVPSWQSWKRRVWSDPTLPLEDQFFQTFCLLSGALSLGVILPINAFQNLSPWVNRGIFGFGVLCLIIAWLARQRRLYKKTLIVALVMLLDLTWFPNGGTYGSIGLYFFTAALFVVIFLDGATRVTGLVVLAADITGLQLLEYHYPHLLNSFKLPADRLIDLTSGYLISLGTSVLILWVVLAGFDRERVRVKGTLRILLDREAELRAIFESSQDAVGVTRRGTIEMVNPAFLTMFGFNDLEEILGRSMMDFIAPESQDSVQRMIDEPDDGRALAGEVIGMRKDTRQFPMEVRVSGFEQDGCPHTVVNLRDLSESKRLERERKQYEAQARRNEKMDSLGALAGGVAHDMNNVLGAVMSLASVHLADAPAGSPLRKDMETIAKACQRGGSMVKGLLGFAHETLPVQHETDLNAVVRDAIALLERTTLQRIRLEVDLARDLSTIRGDPAALAHALMNLCVNALDAMAEGGVLTVRTRDLDERTVLLEVIDTGCGMRKETLDKAMDPFFTTKPLGKGTGLGLPIVFGTVKAHQGKMEIESEDGRGTHVRLYFPAHGQLSKEARATVEPTPIAFAKPLNVLLIDDDELIQHAVHRLLRAMGHTVTTVSGGPGAVGVVQAGLRPDLIILDMNMPGWDGAATLPRLRALLPRVPVLISTGRADQEALKLVSTYPCVTMLPKPFNTRDLGLKIESLAKRARSQ